MVANIKACFCPDVNRERYYREFEDATLRPSEDPTLFLWRLKDSLRTAEPTLCDSAFDALLRRQFMKALPSSLALKLLETDPTSSLEFMVSFVQRHRALTALPSGPFVGIPNCAVQSGTAPQQPTKPFSVEFDALLALHQKQQDHFAQIKAMVSSLSDSHAHLMAAVTPPHITRQIGRNSEIGPPPPSNVSDVTSWATLRGIALALPPADGYNNHLTHRFSAAFALAGDTSNKTVPIIRTFLHQFVSL